MASPPAHRYLPHAIRLAHLDDCRRKHDRVRECDRLRERRVRRGARPRRRRMPLPSLRPGRRRRGDALRRHGLRAAVSRRNPRAELPGSVRRLQSLAWPPWRCASCRKARPVAASAGAGLHVRRAGRLRHALGLPSLRKVTPQRRSVRRVVRQPVRYVAANVISSPRSRHAARSTSSASPATAISTSDGSIPPACIRLGTPSSAGRSSAA